MKESKTLKNEIRKKLSYYEVYILQSNNLGLYDFSKECENIFCKVFNILYDAKYINLNYQNFDINNYPAIDLGDKSKKDCIQITSNTTKNKIIKTINIFNNHKLNTLFNTISIFRLSTKGYKGTISGIHRIFGFTELLKELENVEYDKLLKIYEVLDRELPNPSLPKEVMANNCEKKGNDYSKYIKTLYGDEAHKEFIDTVKQDLNALYNELNKLPKTARELMYYSIIFCRDDIKSPYMIEMIGFNINALYERYNGNRERVDQLLTIINSNKHLNTEADEERSYLMEYRFMNQTEDYDVLFEIVKFCEKTNTNLRDVIVELNFKVLDKE